VSDPHSDPTAGVARRGGPHSEETENPQ
jgi:hypothetical protein